MGGKKKDSGVSIHCGDTKQRGDFLNIKSAINIEKTGKAPPKREQEGKKIRRFLEG